MTARNLPPSGPIPERLVAALARDLYALETGQRASAVFERLAAPLVDRVDEARLRDARSMLAAIDALEADVRAGDVAAVRRAADLARSVEEALRSLARASR
ncbi:MAG: hypothetical protein IT379_15725 [Deltaproteobacteria bacterium]|nr:hypothetical protein [Deltaproteobacteria bacterium]